MKTLLILRHAKSSWSDASLSDHDRPLNKRGKGDAPKMGSLLRAEELTPDLIISSSAKRAIRTAEGVAETCGFDGQIIATRDLYHADPESYFEVLRLLGERNAVVMVVGHNPGMEELLESLTGEWVRMPTAALAEVRMNTDDWSSVSDGTSGELANLWLPRELI